MNGITIALNTILSTIKSLVVIQGIFIIVFCIFIFFVFLYLFTERR